MKGSHQSSAQDPNIPQEQTAQSKRSKMAVNDVICVVLVQKWNRRIKQPQGSRLLAVPTRVQRPHDTSRAFPARPRNQANPFHDTRHIVFWELREIMRTLLQAVPHYLIVDAAAIVRYICENINLVTLID